ncbi:MAG: hypothetical protein B1H11_09650 [Desulfobacteraceae bacterium 4484_190.1]|nr:MAG: hypothetical protein B1H11_09650 [Desulfobacteraceae bacterium 4484_190.1]
MKSSIVFLYPGQGSQKVGMGHDLYQAYKETRRMFDQADNLLGFSLSRICFEGPEEKLASDLNAQLAIYTVSCVLTDLLKANNITPDMASGYSSGFYAAAYRSCYPEYPASNNNFRAYSVSQKGYGDFSPGKCPGRIYYTCSNSVSFRFYETEQYTLIGKNQHGFHQ